MPIETRSIAGRDVHAVGGGVLLACLAEKIGRDDVAKTNLAAILEQHGIQNMRSL